MRWVGEAEQSIVKTYILRWANSTDRRIITIVEMLTKDHGFQTPNSPTRKSGSRKVSLRVF